MPTLITHAAFGATGAYLFRAPPHEAMRLWGLSLVCAVLPDADVVGYHWLYVPAGHFFGHRGISHSLLFSAVASLLVVGVFFRNWKVFSRQWRWGILYFFLVSTSHGLLDAMTNGGMGIALLSPFTSDRFFLPWTPIEVSPFGIRALFSPRGISVLSSEALWVGIPLGVAVVAWGAVRRRRKIVLLRL